MKASDMSPIDVGNNLEAEEKARIDKVLKLDSDSGDDDEEEDESEDEDIDDYLENLEKKA